MESPLARKLPLALFVAALVASLVYLLIADAGLSFVGDDFELLIRRPGWSPGVLLHPFNESLVLAPALIYELLLDTVGIGSAMPYFVVSTLLFSTSGLLLFLLLRSRVDGWVALLLTLPVLFLGAASEDLFWAFQMGYFGSVACGLGMLLALDRGGRRADLFAALLLLGSLAFGSIGIAFAAAFFTRILLEPGPRRRRLARWAIPVALYVVWYLGWGHAEGSQASFHKLVHLPGFVFNSAAAGIAALLGQEVGDLHTAGQAPVLFQALAAVAGLALLLGAARRRGLPRGLAVALVLMLAIWVLAGLNRSFGRFPTSSRYQYASAVFIVLVAAEALRGFEPRRLVAAAAFAVAVVGVVGGIHLMARELPGWERLGGESRAALAGVDLGGAGIGPGFEIDSEVEATAGEYRSQAVAHGSPAFSEAALLGGLPVYAERADATMIDGLGIALEPEGPSTAAPGVRRCRSPEATAGEPTRLSLRPGRYLLHGDGRRPVSLGLSRFGPAPGVSLGTVAAGGRRRLLLPRGASSHWWTLAGSAGGRVEACALAR